MDKHSEYHSLRDSGLFDFLMRNLKPLAVVGLSSFIISLIIALLLPSKYKASVILFPATSESISKSLISENNLSKGTLDFGTDEEIEQFLQVLYSEEIIKKIVKKHNLFEHYGIDTSENYPNTRLRKKYNNNINFRSTEFLSIEIEVFDTDPVKAAAIANDISDYADSVINNMQHLRAVQAFNLIESEYLSTLKELEFIQDSLAKLRELGVFNYEAQSEVFSDAYALAVAQGNKSGVRELEEKFKILAKYGGAYQNFSEILINETKRLSNLKQKYSEAKIDLEHNITHKFVVSYAEPPEKEYYPIRWLVVVISVLSSLFFCSVLLSFYEQQKKKLYTLKFDYKQIKKYINANFVLFNYENMEAYFRNNKFIEVATKWKKHLAAILIISAGIGIFISSPIVMKPRYKSSAIIYPVNIYAYSEESTTEQMLQVLNSNDIAQNMMESFGLLKHYKIDTINPQHYSIFIDEYNDNVSVSKTEFESVEITVLDINPKIACLMVDSIIGFYNKKIASLHRKKHYENLEISQNQFAKKQREVDSLEILLNEYRIKKGIMSYYSQVIEATRGNISNNKQAGELYKNLQEFGVNYQRIDSLLWYARRDFLYFKNIVEKETEEVNKNISYAQIISNPIVPDKKAYPIRWLVVLATVFSTILFSLIIISLIESRRK